MLPMKTPPSQPTRRSFLTSSLAAGAALPLVSRLPAAASHRPSPKKILVLGGTGFLGPHFVRAALANSRAAQRASDEAAAAQVGEVGQALFTSEDAMEAVAAMTERRDPVFRGA